MFSYILTFIISPIFWATGHAFRSNFAASVS